MKVFGVTGLPGSGKSIISRIAKKEGVYTISMGDVIRKEAERRNCTPGEAAVNLRKQYGNNIVADRCIQEIFNHSKRIISRHDIFAPFCCIISIPCLNSYFLLLAHTSFAT